MCLDDFVTHVAGTYRRGGGVMGADAAYAESQCNDSDPLR